MEFSVVVAVDESEDESMKHGIAILKRSKTNLLNESPRRVGVSSCWMRVCVAILY